MIIQRITVPYSKGKRDKAIVLLNTYCRRATDDGIFQSQPRIFAPAHDESITVGYFEFEDATDMERRWQLWQAASYYADFADAYYPLVDVGDMQGASALEAMKFEIELRV